METPNNPTYIIGDEENTRNTIMELEPRSNQSLYFEPDNHPHDTLKVFNEFCDTFTLRYNALYPDPPKVSMDAALARWKVENRTTEAPDPTPTLPQYDTIRNNWRSKDKVLKFLGLYSFLDSILPNGFKQIGLLVNPMPIFERMQHGHYFNNTYVHTTNPQKIQH